MNNLSFAVFRELENIQASDLSALDKSLYCICAVYGITEEDLDKMNPKKVLRMADKVTFQFNNTVQLRTPKWIGPYKLLYNVKEINLGQYIELAYFFQKPVHENGYYVLATMSNSIISWYNGKSHSDKAKYFYYKKYSDIVGAASEIMKRFNELNALFNGLFDKQEGSMGDAHFFNKRYGWIYSASVIAEYYRITLEEAYALPIMKALNALVYLKAKQSYDKYVQSLNKQPVNGR